jgi:hypothetical protein
MKKKDITKRVLDMEKNFMSTDLPAPARVVSSNSKTGQSFNSLLSFCDGRTDICRAECYACHGRLSMPATVRKACAVRQFVEEYGAYRSAQRVCWEITQPTFRWMARGDFDPLYVDLANRAAWLRPEIKHYAFSRQINALSYLDKSITKVLSIDKTSRDLLCHIPDNWIVAYLKTEVDEHIPMRVDVIFPLNHRKSLIDGDERICSFYLNGQVTCNTCRRCIEERRC